VHLIAHILNRAVTPDNQRLVKLGLFAASLGVDAHQIQLFPAALDDVLDAEVEFAGHDGGVGFAGEGVEVVEGDGVDFVVDVEAEEGVLVGDRLRKVGRGEDLPLDVFAVVFHDYVDEVVDGCWARACVLVCSSFETVRNANIPFSSLTNTSAFNIL